MAGWRKTKDGVDAQLPAGGAEVVIDLLEDVIALLSEDDAVRGETAEGDGSDERDDAWARELGLGDLSGIDLGLAPERPDDPAVARLLPDGSVEDPLAAMEYRRFSEQTIRSTKLQHLNLAVRAMAKEQTRTIRGLVLHLDDREAHAVMRALGDLRLVMATRLGIETEADAEALHEWIEADDGDDVGLSAEQAQGRWLVRSYDFVTWLQEMITTVLLGELPTEGDGRRIPPSLD